MSVQTLAVICADLDICSLEEIALKCWFDPPELRSQLLRLNGTELIADYKEIK